MSKLTQIYSWSLPANHLFNLSLMKDNENKYNKYFIWLNIVPGEKGDAGARSFNFKNGVAFKITPLKLAELAHAINAYVRGQSKLIGRFAIMVDGSKSAATGGAGEKKQLFLKYNPPEDDKNPTLFLNAKSSNSDKAIGLQLEIPTALALADLCQKVFDKSFEIDFKTFEPVQRAENGEERSYSGKNNKSKGSEEEPMNFTDDPF